MTTFARTKNSCCDVQIKLNMMHLTPRAKFLDNTHNNNKIQGKIIHLLSSAFQKHQITVELSENDSDTSIVKAVLAAAKDDSVEVSELHQKIILLKPCESKCNSFSISFHLCFSKIFEWSLCFYSISFFQVQAEDADVLILL